MGASESSFCILGMSLFTCTVLLCFTLEWMELGASGTYVSDPYFAFDDAKTLQGKSTHAKAREMRKAMLT